MGMMGSPYSSIRRDKTNHSFRLPCCCCTRRAQPCRRDCSPNAPRCRLPRTTQLRLRGLLCGLLRPLAGLRYSIFVSLLPEALCHLMRPRAPQGVMGPTQARFAQLRSLALLQCTARIPRARFTVSIAVQLCQAFLAFATVMDPPIPAIRLHSNSIRARTGGLESSAHRDAGARRYSDRRDRVHQKHSGRHDRQHEWRSNRGV